MKIEDICSLELAKELEKLGVRQESKWYWAIEKTYVDGRMEGGWVEQVYLNDGKLTKNFRDNITPKNYSAFTADEMDELMPKNCHIGKDTVNKSYGFWKKLTKNKLIIKDADSKADVKAKKLIYFLKNER